ncbi:hypothetical protein L596_020171 [Steinernema carpocapsae]|uniref:Uncharacterized protein n=1 Tax=Steinernema carpocapsae TaxID=34508 RepID=A0A4U5MSQ5_STECR|nr:hypothetical protein L596_020171 [Steinernema carpocapsae]
MSCGTFRTWKQPERSELGGRTKSGSEREGNENSKKIRVAITLSRIGEGRKKLELGVLKKREWSWKKRGDVAFAKPTLLHACIFLRLESFCR